MGVVMKKHFEFIQDPKFHHPIFYGCFDWHSSAHGHWLLAALMRKFPDTELSKNITAVFDEQFKVIMMKIQSQCSNLNEMDIFCRSTRLYARQTCLRRTRDLRDLTGGPGSWNSIMNFYNWEKLMRLFCRICYILQIIAKTYFKIFFSFFFQSHSWSKNLQPLADYLIGAYKDFLPKLAYPVRVGEHANSAFGLIFPFEYAQCKNFSKWWV